MPMLTKQNKTWGIWLDEMDEDNMEPDGLTIVFMAHFIGRNITLVSGKCEEWKAVDADDDIVLLYRGDYSFALTDVGIYLFVQLMFLTSCALKINN